MVRILLSTACVLSIAGTASAQSFDCAKAQTPVEKMVCADPGLRDLDEYLERYYAAAREAVGAGASCLQADQAVWLKSARGGCRDAACLKAAYLTRLAELDPLQPGATAIQNLALPDVPALVWIIGPASDTTAAPANPKAAPFDATGRIVDELADGDGFVLHAADGRKVPIAVLMFLEGGTSTALAALAKERDATYRVRGFAAEDDGRTFIEPSRCTFISRVPAAGKASPAPPGSGDDQEMERVRTRVVTQGKVCPDPERPCEGFKANELSFAIAQPFAFDRGRDQSQPFYAVLLKSGPLCGIDDRERIEAQERFPGAKVFLQRHMCEDFGDKVTYSNVNEKMGFVAVYAGESAADAAKVLAQAKAAGYAGANVRRMAAIVVYQIE